MAIKKSIARLEMLANLLAVLEQEQIAVLAAADLPMRHQEWFDRMQIAQAQDKGPTLITHDEQIQRYDVPTMSV